VARPRVRRISTHVYCVQRTVYASCSYFVARPHDVVLVDAGIDPTGGDMLAGLAEAGRSVREVSWILLTHWHNDHSAGAAVLQEQSGARVCYHAAGAAKFLREEAASGVRARLARLLPDAGWLAPLRGLLDAAPPRPLRAHHHATDGEIVAEDFEVLETPGHDAGHVCYLYRPDRVLFAGDALAVAGDHVTFMSRYLTQDQDAARASMLRCLSLDVKAICPGHRYPLVDPDPAQLAALRAKVARLKRFPVFGA